MNMRTPTLICVLLLLSACVKPAFVQNPVDASNFMSRGITQNEAEITVTAAVPTAAETIEIFGIDLYADGIQPVWLQVENQRDTHLRVAHYSIDADYYPPLEIAWLYRKQFNKKSRSAMENWLLETSMPRYVDAGETRSGFVYTHLSKGTKGFFVDIHGDITAVNFSFFVPLPGFKPDYENVEFSELYSDDDILEIEFDSLRTQLEEFTCCTTDESGERSGDPLNAVLVGTPEAVRISLLRGGWQETELSTPATFAARQHYFAGRQPDAMFYMTRPDGSERKELRLWIAPMLVDGETVWLGTVNYEMSGSSGKNARIDPDIDDARMFLLQNFWYNQSLRSFALVSGIPPADIDAPARNFDGFEHFTDGYRAVLMLSEAPIAMDETQILLWEPYRGR